VNNCLGRDNYSYFLALLVSLTLLEVYGAWLGWSILLGNFDYRLSPTATVFSMDFLSDLGLVIIELADQGGLSVAGVTFLATLTAPLPFGFLVFHLHLISKGMTTNESDKWNWLAEDIDDGLIWNADRSEIRSFEQQIGKSRGLDNNTQVDVFTNWPLTTNQYVCRTKNNLAPPGYDGLYTKVENLKAIDNLYNLGFWKNMIYITKGL